MPSRSVPPTSFRTGSQTSPPNHLRPRENPVNATNRPPSRNFEDLLQTNETLRLARFQDVLASDSFQTPPSIRMHQYQDSISSEDTNSDDVPLSRQLLTPNVVPPTPVSKLGESKGGHNEEEAPGLERRRSMNRSPGTASSPDLTTLVRKAREQRTREHHTPRLTVEKSNAQQATPSPPSTLQPPPSSQAALSPPTSRLRASSSTSSFSFVGTNEKLAPNADANTTNLTGTLGVRKLSKTPLSSHGQGIESSSSQKSLSKDKGGKSSMRMKTGAFFNKFLPQGSVRDKRRSNSLTAPNTPTSATHARPPLPIPPLPPKTTPSTSTSASSTYSQQSQQPSDVFFPSPSLSLSNSNIIASQDHEPLQQQHALPHLSSPSMIPASTHPLFPPDYSPAPSQRTRDVKAAVHGVRRRSMSVGDVDLSKILAYVEQAPGGPNRAGKEIPKPSTPPVNSNWFINSKSTSTSRSTLSPLPQKLDLGLGSTDDFSKAFKGLTTPTTPRIDRHPLEHAASSPLPIPTNSRPTLGSQRTYPVTSPLLPGGSDGGTSVPLSSSPGSSGTITRASSRHNSLSPLPTAEGLRFLVSPESPSAVPLPATPDQNRSEGSGSDFEPPQPEPRSSSSSQTPRSSVTEEMDASQALSSVPVLHNSLITDRLALPDATSHIKDTNPSIPLTRGLSMDSRSSMDQPSNATQPIAFAARTSSLRLPPRNPNPFGAGPSPGGATATNSFTSSTTLSSPNPRINTLRVSGRSSAGGTNRVGSLVGVAGSPSTSPTLSISSASGPRSPDMRSSAAAARARIQPRAAASASEPLLVNPVASASSTGVTDDGMHLSASRYDGHTVRLVPSSNSIEQSQSQLRSSSATWSSHPGSSALSVATTVDSSAHSKMHHANTSAVSILSGATDLEPDELDARAREIAGKLWANDESLLPLDKVAEWLGGTESLRRLTLKHYMNYFDFTGLRLDNAFRHLCGKLYVRGETQQVDRILEAFSARFWDCNSIAIYHSPDVVHALAYSLLLLNTDLHIADISSKMSRGQFVRNTFAVIQPQVIGKPGLVASSMATSGGSSSTLAVDDAPRASISVAHESASTSNPQNKPRSDSTASWKSFGDSKPASHSAVQLTAPSSSDSPSASRVSITLSGVPNPVSTPGHRASQDVAAPLSGKAWETEIETLLRDMYTAVKNQQILQPIGNDNPSTSSLAPSSGAIARRGSLSRTNGPSDRYKRGSIRGLHALLGTQTPYGSSSNSSVDGRVSPSPSFATSIGDGLGGSDSGFFPAPTLGFASNLSHSIIREAQEDDARSLHSVDSNSTNISISDEELALLGAPWAKEGMLSRKQYWESTKRRAKNKYWMDVFVVIQKGQLNMFTFGEGGSSGSGMGVGGGNWLSNATPVGEFSLAHSLAHALPPPGYNRQRPHCFVLTLSDGAVYFFQAGTEDLVNEWVSTCNYWAARQSREPLSGGVSNMEYGWSRVEPRISFDDDDVPSNTAPPPSSNDPTDTFSIRSGRSNKFGAKRSWAEIPGSVRSLHNPNSADRMHINDWKPPMHPTVPSTNDEETQLEALQKRVSSLKAELTQHNDLRKPMENLYSLRSANSEKALVNWEQKSQYLLAEIIKYESYVESLRHAMTLRLKHRGEKVLERALIRTSEEEYEDNLHLGSKTNSTSSRNRTVRASRDREDTIEEDEEPLTPGPRSGFAIHRREMAEVDDD